MARKRYRLDGNIQGDCTTSLITSLNTDSTDYLSNLPESILSHILSLLSTKQGVKTCLLSKDWMDKWTYVYNLLLDDNEYESFLKGEEKSVRFITFMNVLAQFPFKSSITSVYLKCHRKYDPFYLSIWVSALIRRKLTVLELTTYPCVVYPLRNCLSDFISLTELKISSACNLKVPGRLCLKNIKILELGGGIEIENEQSCTDNLLLIFPVLEVLTLGGCRWLNVNFVEINAPQLTQFTSISVSHIWSGCVLKIFGEKLVQFESTGAYIDNLVLSAPSVDYAGVNNMIEFYNDSIKQDILVSRALSILQGFSDVKYLKLASYLVQVVISKYPFPSFNNVKQLDYSCLCVEPCESLFPVLGVLPSLEILCLHMIYKLHYNLGVEIFPSSLVSHLKEVIFIDFLATPSHFQLANIVLKNAVNLEKIVVFVAHGPRMPRSEVKGQMSTFCSTSVLVNVISSRGMHHGGTGSRWIKW